MVEQRAGLSVSRVKPAYQQVADQLRTLILNGELTSGDRLPSEAEMVAQFGVSRSTVREALRALASRDLVHTRRGVTGGTFVSDVDPTRVADYLEASLGLMTGRDDLGMASMLEAREILEVPAARLAAQRRNDDHLDLLRATLDRELATGGSEGAFTERRTFHQAVIEAAQNPLLSMVSEPVFRVLQTQFLRPDLGVDDHARVDDDHAAILAAIEAGDGDTAAELMAEHLVRLRSTYQT